jgi:hypothetical protein
MRFALMVVFLALAGGCGSIRPGTAGDIEVGVRTLVLDAADPERHRVGRLEWRGGLELTSPDPRFGGLSSLRITPDGGRLVAVSDGGWRLDARLQYDTDGRLVGLYSARLAPLLSRSGRPLPEINREESDAESMILEPDGSLIVGFEGNHRIVLYPADGRKPSLIPPPRLEDAPANSGLESLVRLRDGRLLAITENLAVSGGVRGWIGDGKAGGWRPLVWRTSDAFLPTDAALLPSGDILVLERRFPPVGARLRRLSAASIAPGAVLDGLEIARLEGSLNVDNMEGIDVQRAAFGETLVWILSDDNYSFLQRTLLLHFRLLE